MEVTDVFMGPVFLVIIYLAAYAVRDRFTNRFTKAYFIPALSAKLFGAVALGLVYQFYYGGGDTFNYYYHSSLIHQAFMDSFGTGWKLIMSGGGDYYADTAKYTQYMLWYRGGSSEYFLARIAGLLSLICFDSYIAISLCFACLSFSGMWVMYMTFVKIRPQLFKQLATATFFIPSVYFWGSGLLKDSIAIGALGWLFYAFFRGAVQRDSILKCLVYGGLASFLLIKIKVYILLCFLPPALLYIFNENSARIKSKVTRFIATPFLVVAGLGMAYFASTNLTKGDEDYDVENIGARSKKTSDYLYQVSVKQNGSGYKLGEQDGTIGGMVKLAPQAIVVALFRPFLWEVHNPVMLMSSLEALYFLFFTLRILYRSGLGKTLALISSTPSLILCFVFALVFAATVGVVSNNFGTLVRYKIPMIPFYVAGLYITESMSVNRRAVKRQKANAKRDLATA